MDRAHLLNFALDTAHAYLRETTSQGKRRYRDRLETLEGLAVKMHGREYADLLHDRITDVLAAGQADRSDTKARGGRGGRL